MQKPTLSFWQIWNMSFGFLGIQFGFALQNANTSRIFSTLGANPDDLSLFWLAAPVTGLLVQPIIGYLSDNTWHPTWGRRRPFFFAGALLALLAFSSCALVSRSTADDASAQRSLAASFSACSAADCTTLPECRPHSFALASSHHHRPSRSCWLGSTAFVQGSQPIET